MERHASSSLLSLTLLALSCGGSSLSAPNPPSSPPVSITTITITAAGANPQSIQVDLGARVLFVNNDTHAHNMASDPHPDHMDCPEINQAGFLLPGQSRETGNLVQTRTCGFHDHDNPDNHKLHGTIIIR